MATSTISIKTKFADDTTRTWSLSPFATDAPAIDNLKSNVININNNIENLRGKLVSDKGYDISKISEATITTTEKTLVYSKTGALGLRAMAYDEGGNGDD